MRTEQQPPFKHADPVLVGSAVTELRLHPYFQVLQNPSSGYLHVGKRSPLRVCGVAIATPVKTKFWSFS